MTLSIVRASAEAPDAPSPRATLEEIYTAHHGMVYRLGLRYGNGDTQWAQDLAQDVFVELFAQPSRLDGVANVQAWLYRVATHRCLNLLRRERFLQSAPVRWLLESKGGPVGDPEALGMTDERLRRVFGVVQQMAPKMRACFFMHYVDGKSQTQIAEILGCSKSSVCKILGRIKLCLEDLGLGEEGVC